VREHLPRIGEGGGLASVLDHCMYCGASLGRVGLDCRPLLAPLFEQAVLALYSRVRRHHCWVHELVSPAFGR
jgi:hypothetical protein